MCTFLCVQLHLFYSCVLSDVRGFALPGSFPLTISLIPAPLTATTTRIARHCSHTPFRERGILDAIFGFITRSFLDFLLRALHDPSLEGPPRRPRTNSVSPAHSRQTLECSRAEKPHQPSVAHLAVIRGSLSANQGILSGHRGVIGLSGM